MSEVSVEVFFKGVVAVRVLASFCCLHSNFGEDYFGFLMFVQVPSDGAYTEYNRPR